MPKGNVLVIIGEEKIGQEVSETLTKRGYKTQLVTSANAGRSIVRYEHPDLVILDIDDPEAASLQTCSELRVILSEPIIVISSETDDTNIVLGLGLGADAYLTKPISMPVLLAYVDAALRRETIYRQQGSHNIKPLYVRDMVVDVAGCELRRNNSVIPLSPTEFRLIRALAENAGRVLSRDQLLDSVWESHADGVYSRTVDVHIGRLRRKIEREPEKPDYIITVAGVGYKLREGT